MRDAAALRGDARGHALELGLAPARQHHAHAGARERHRRRLADAGARAGHPGHLAVEITHVVQSP